MSGYQSTKAKFCINALILFLKSLQSPKANVSCSDVRIKPSPLFQIYISRYAWYFAVFYNLLAAITSCPQFTVNCDWLQRTLNQKMNNEADPLPRSAPMCELMTAGYSQARSEARPCNQQTGSEAPVWCRWSPHGDGWHCTNLCSFQLSRWQFHIAGQTWSNDSIKINGRNQLANKMCGWRLWFALVQVYFWWMSPFFILNDK